VLRRSVVIVVNTSLSEQSGSSTAACKATSMGADGRKPGGGNLLTVAIGAVGGKPPEGSLPTASMGAVGGTGLRSFPKAG